MPARWVDKDLIITHPALHRPQESFYGNMATERFDPTYQFSWEMVEMLNRLYQGVFDSDNPGHVRALKAAMRKSCYPDVLLNEVGVLMPAGLEATQNARILWQRIMEDTDRKPDATKMDGIIVFGRLNIAAIRMLNLLWELLPEGRRGIQDYHATATYTHVWRTETIEADGTPYLVLSSIRNNIYARKAGDLLIKYGLVDMVNLPSITRGRPPIGIALSEPGKLFFEDFLPTFDPGAAFKRDISTPPPVDLHPANTYVPQEVGPPDTGDIVDGEDLRDLFG